MLKQGLVLCAILLFTGCTSDPSITHTDKRSLSGLERHLLNTAWETLQEKCPAVKQTDDVVLSMKRIDPDWCMVDEECESYGWTFKAQVQVLQGEEEHFYWLGQGDKPGIISVMPESSQICGWEVVNDYKNFVDVEW